MAKVVVSKFRYYNRAEQTWVEAPDYATAKAIKTMGGIPVVGTEILVDESRVSFSGIVSENSSECALPKKAQ